MQNVFQDFTNKLSFANHVNSETARSKVLKFLAEMENQKKKICKKIFFAKNPLVRFCEMAAECSSVFSSDSGNFFYKVFHC